MVDVRPFRALRYAGLSREELGAVSCPPYDIITPQMQEALYARHPMNAVRLVLGKEEPGDDARENRILRARAHLKRWLKEGHLALDREEALYPYAQTFSSPEGGSLARKGFFAAVRLERYGQGSVFPHEHTFPKTKSYLRELWGTCGVHLGPIFAFYDEPEDRAGAALEEAMGEEPLADFEDEGVRHTLWRLTDLSAIRTLRETLAGRAVFIADGHHRYETSLDLQERWRRERGKGEGAWDETLMFLANVRDPGMVVLATHRLLVRKPLRGLEGALRGLEGEYDLSRLPLEGDAPGLALARRLAELGGGESGQKRTAFALYAGGGEATLLVRRASTPLGEGLSLEEAVAGLDVSVLHRRILGEVLGTAGGEEDLRYTPHPEEALAAARGGECGAAFLLNPARIEEVQSIARSGGRMPHKTTYFYPKVRTGLLFHPLDLSVL